jgi:hypothetical protein
MSVQVAIACVLLVGASLLGRSFVSLVTADRGFDPTAVLSARVAMPAAIYRSEEQRFGIIERILDRLSAAPGMTEAAFTSELPLTPAAPPARSTCHPRLPAARSRRRRRHGSSARYFLHSASMIAGRGFDIDTDSSAVVRQPSFARRPVGARWPPHRRPMSSRSRACLDGHRRRRGRRHGLGHLTA